MSKEKMLVDIDRKKEYPFNAFFVFGDCTKIDVNKTERFLDKIKQVGVDNVELTSKALSQIECDYEDYREWSGMAYANYSCGDSGNPLRYDDSISLLYLLKTPKDLEQESK